MLRSSDRTAFGVGAVIAVSLLLLAPATLAGPVRPTVVLRAPFHGTGVFGVGVSNGTCGKEHVTNPTKFVFASGTGGSAVVRALATSCLGFAGGGQNYAVYYETVTLRFHGISGRHSVAANFYLRGSGGVALVAGSCGRGNSSNWSCSDLAQSALDSFVLLVDLSNGSAYAPIAGSGGQLGTEMTNSTSCSGVGKCAYTTGYNVCTVSAGCLWVGRHGFSPTWSGSIVSNSTFGAFTMNRTHIYGVEVIFSESAWVSCQNGGAFQAGCRAKAWVSPGPGGIGLDVASITVS